MMRASRQALTRSARGRINRADGESAQHITMELMKDLGYRCVEKIETGMTLKRQDGAIVGAFPSAKVSGDIRAIGPKGITIHCECKYRPEKEDGRLVLQWSDFEKHQIEHLEAVTEAGGLAFVSWVTSLYPARLFWLQWPIPMRKGKALTAAEAARIRMEHFGFQNPNRGNHG